MREGSARRTGVRESIIKEAAYPDRIAARI